MNERPSEVVAVAPLVAEAPKSRGRLFRPIGIVPLSPTWSAFQLDARQQAAAIYLFEPGISVREQLTVSYQGLSSDWSHAVRLLDQERARVKARALVGPR